MNAPDRPWLVPVGGFLGAGKTTLILAAARLLLARGIRCAAILNDQGDDLVDTELVRRHEIEAAQVAGGCFCCRFSDFLAAMGRLAEHRPSVLFAEPVGSCTDLSATILQPLKQDCAPGIRLAPLTVAVDPAQSRDLLSESADPDMAFLFRNQIEEADLVAFTKSDLRSEFPELPGASVRYLSARTGQGIAEWLDEVLSGALPAGARLLDLDYPRYARAEAALAWLNWRAAVRLSRPLTPAYVIGPFMDGLDAALSGSSIRIAHLKVIGTAATGYVKAAQTGNGREPDVEGQLDAAPASRHEVLLNLRAVADPAILERIVRAEIARLPGKCRGESLQCFRPGAPKPERRVGKFIE